MKTFSLALSISLLLAGPAAAAKVKTWTAHAAADYDKAQLRQAVVSSEGAVRLARRLKPVAGQGLHARSIASRSKRREPVLAGRLPRGWGRGVRS